MATTAMDLAGVAERYMTACVECDKPVGREKWERGLSRCDSCCDAIARAVDEWALAVIALLEDEGVFDGDAEALAG